jgi:hypothetical protein
MIETLERRSLMSAGTGGVFVAAGDVNGDGRADQSSGNTYYVGSANGGVWKTTNMTDPRASNQIIGVLIG